MGSEGEGEVETQKWRYTWEAQSHTPNLRLLLFPFPFSKTLNPSLNLTVHLHSPPSFLTLTSTALSLSVPIPNVLLDADFPPAVRSFSDHIEVKLLLLLPVDHPVLSVVHQTLPLPQPLLMDYGKYFRFLLLSFLFILFYFYDLFLISLVLCFGLDVDKLSSAGEVEFVCRSCQYGLTKKPIR